MKFESEDKKVEAFRFLKSLKRGDEVWVSTNGQDELMFVTREIDLSNSMDFRRLSVPMWEFANVHVSPGLGKNASSITVQQQYRKEKELPFITGKYNDKLVRVVEIGPELYKRMDELSKNYSNAQAYHSALKNMLSKRAKQAPEDSLV